MKNRKRKIGRNEPCLCGSGKKYKKCCMNIKLNIQLNQLSKHINFANTDLTHLKSAVRPLKIIHNKRKENIKILKKFCPHFKIIDDIGNCKKFKLICKSWEYDYIINCKEDCVKNCAAYSKGAKMIEGIPDQLKIALEKCKERIKGIIKTTQRDEVISYLLQNLEICAAESLTISPSELVSIIRIRNWMHKNFGDLRKFNFLVEVKDKSKCYELWLLLIERLLLEEHISMLEVGDVVFIVSSKGQEKLEKIATDPLFEQKESLKRRFAYERNPELVDEIFTRERSYSLFWTNKMIPVIRWCMINNLNPVPGGESFNKQYKTIIKHTEDVGEKKSLDPSDCLNLGWPLFITFFQTYRYCALTYPWLIDLLKSYKDSKLEEKILAKNTFSPWFWDNFVVNIPWPRDDPLKRELKIFEEKLGIEIHQHEKWPIEDDEHSLIWSKIVIGFGLKYFAEISTTPKKTGMWFEQVIYDELTERNIPVSGRNIDLPNGLGDIDLLSYTAYWNYIIEVKEWGPRGKIGYFSSKDYNERLDELNREVMKLEKRVEWAEKNRHELKIPDHAGIIGIFLTAYEEPDITIPDKILKLTHDKLCGIIGGKPVNPILGLKAHPIKFETRKKTKKKDKIKRLKEGVAEGLKLNANERNIMDFASERIIDIYGDIDAYHAFRAIYEISEAFKINGVSVKELSTENIERPPILTKQYISFILFRGDDLSIEEINEAYNLLIEKGLIIVTRNNITIKKIPELELWKARGMDFISVEDEDSADIILNKRETVNISDTIKSVGMFPPFIRMSKGITLMDIRYLIS